MRIIWQQVYLHKGEDFKGIILSCTIILVAKCEY